MIRDLSQTLRAMLKQSGLPKELAAAEIAFDRPGQNFRPGQTIINLFLYDIRENLELRNAEPVLERVNGHAVRHPRPLRVDCTYLVTAWPVGGEDIALQEHDLLAQTLQVFARHPTIPIGFLQGNLRDQQPPLPLITSQPDGLKEPAEFWSAIGGRLRPSLSVTATIGLEVFAAEKPLPLVTTETIRITQRAGNEWLPLPETEERFRIGGRVLAVDRKDAAGATVSLLEAGLSTTADADGRYVIGPVVAGQYTLSVQSGRYLELGAEALTSTVAVTIPLPPTSPPGNYDVRLTSSSPP
jgi:hypothetical protein